MSRNLIILILLVASFLGYSEYSDDKLIFINPVTLISAFLFILFIWIYGAQIISRSFLLVIIFISLLPLFLWFPFAKIYGLHQVYSLDVCNSSPDEIVSFYKEDRASGGRFFDGVLFSRFAGKEIYEFYEYAMFNDRSCLSSLYNIFGLIYTREGIYDSATYFLSKSLEKAQEYKDDLAIAEAYLGFSIMFSFQHEAVKEGDEKYKAIHESVCKYAPYSKQMFEYIIPRTERVESGISATSEIIKRYKCDIKNGKVKTRGISSDGN